MPAQDQSGGVQNPAAGITTAGSTMPATTSLQLPARSPNFGLVVPLPEDARGGQAPQPSVRCTNRQRLGAGAAPTEPPAEPPPPPPPNLMPVPLLPGGIPVLDTADSVCGIATQGDGGAEIATGNRNAASASSQEAARDVAPRAAADGGEEAVPPADKDATDWVGWPGGSGACRPRTSGVVTSADWPSRFEKPSGMSLAPSPPPELPAIAGCWQDTLGNNVQVPYPPDDPQDPTAYLTNDSQGRRQVRFGLDKFGRLWCGNGVLYRIGYPNLDGDHPSHLAWRTVDWRISVWTRADKKLAGAEGEVGVATPAKNRQRHTKLLAMEGPSSSKAPRSTGAGGGCGRARGRQLSFDPAPGSGNSSWRSSKTAR